MKYLKNCRYIKYDLFINIDAYVIYINKRHDSILGILFIMYYIILNTINQNRSLKNLLNTICNQTNYRKLRIAIK